MAAGETSDGAATGEVLSNFRQAENRIAVQKHLVLLDQGSSPHSLALPGLSCHGRSDDKGGEGIWTLDFSRTL